MNPIERCRATGEGGEAVFDGGTGTDIRGRWRSVYDSHAPARVSGVMSPVEGAPA